MFPMLGPRRESRKKKQVKTVRLVEPTIDNEPSITSSGISNRAIHQSSPPLPPLPPLSPPPRKPSPSNSSINPSTLSPQTLIVISFITRLPLKKNHGQGTEILFYKPKATLNPSESHHCAFKCVPKHPQGPGSKWTFLFIDGGPIEETTSDQLSLRSIKRHLAPPDDKLVKVRTSKALRWDNDTLLVSVLYRLKEIDRKKDEEWIKMDVESHYWSKIYGFHSAIENELVSTALAAVSFPVAFNVGFEEIAQQDPHTRSDIVTLKALETLYLSVQAGYARDGFKFYPQTVEPLRKVGNSDRDFKRRMWAYWTEVLCWHLIACKPTYKVSISYALNKILAILKPEVRNDKVNVEELEKRMVEAIGNEADRCRQSVENIVKHAVFEILHSPDHFSLIDSTTSIHLFTLGSSSATYEALTQLVKHFMTQSRWKLGLANERAIEGLKITIAENRPLHEGVILANKLNELIHIYQAPHSAPPKEDPGRTLNHAPSLLALDNLLESKEWYLDANHQKVLDSFEDRHYSPLTGMFAHKPPIGQDRNDRDNLADLLERADISNRQHGVQSRGDSENIKVNIEITTDVGLRTCLLNAGSAGILLLAADRVLPTGDALCKLGSTSAAYMAHKLRQVVIILVRHDRFHPSHDPQPPQPSTPPSSASTSHQVLVSGMIQSWKTIFKHEIIDHLSRKVIIGGSSLSSTTATISALDHTHLLPGFEVVKAEWISCFISDSGKIGIERVKEVADTLSSIHHLLWEENDHNQP